jgi:hypothetical protein
MRQTKGKEFAAGPTGICHPGDDFFITGADKREVDIEEYIRETGRMKRRFESSKDRERWEAAHGPTGNEYSPK